MSVANVTFHGETRFFLHRSVRNGFIQHPFEWRTSIKDMVESLGPPHSEIGLLVIDGQSVDFEHVVELGQHDIAVYDRYDAFQIEPKVRLRPPVSALPEIRFVLDTHLGRLANYLRMMGFDTLYRNDYPDDELAEVSDTQQRILLTRDIGLLKRGRVVYGRYVRETDPKKQITEIMQWYSLNEHVIPFHRCTKCNGVLHPVEKEDVLDQLPEKSASYYDEFRQCDSCGQVYWQGSHYEQMQQFLDAVRLESS